MYRPGGVYSTSYAREIALLQVPFEKVALAIGLVALLAYPAVASPFTMTLTIFVLIAAIGATGMGLLLGFTGQISLAHGGFMAVGAYTAANLGTLAGLDMVGAAVTGGVSAAGVGLFFGVPALRNKGIYLALTTFAGQFIILFVLYLPVLDPWTKTVKGYLMPEPSVLGLAVPYPRRDLFFYYLLLLCGAGALLFVKNLLRSRIGRAFLAVRDNDIVAEMLGVNIFAYKLMAFGVSAFYAGFSGALFAYYAESILPEHFNIFVSINYVFMVVIGGIGRLWGPVLGAVIVVLIPEGLRLLTAYVGTVLPAYVVYTEQTKLIIFGLIVIVLLVGEPRGVIAIWDKVKNYWQAWPYRYI
jgi:branched-chain amino acid transport system permease protein